ncbi:MULTISPECIES: hypothetical protein [unclassified Candidatus Tisiphia]|uniref:hypothetical protein n=1 Tax=unclassified Candidatus Tisiphia TaxID=2996318 RepID=UPI0035C91D52
MKSKNTPTKLIYAGTLILITFFMHISLACMTTIETRSFPYEEDIFDITIPLRQEGILKTFARDSIAILPDKTNLLGLILAYRYLSNNPPTTENLDNLSKPINEEINSQNIWRENSNKIVNEENYLSSYKSVSNKENQVQTSFYFENCLNNAFTFAVELFNDKSKKYNASQIKQWVSNQNKVFNNCDQNVLILPTILSENATKEELDDYNYQLASAYFYAMHYDTSSELFTKISESDSQYKDLALYLIFRSLFRQIKYQNKDNNDFFVLYKKLQPLINTSPFKAEIDKLLKYFIIKQDINKEVIQLSEQLISKEIRSEDYNDFRYLVSDYNDHTIKNGLITNHPFLEWANYFYIQDNFLDTYKKWQNYNSLPWLILSLKKIKLSDIKSQEAQKVIQKAQEITENTQGYILTQYYLAKLALSEKNYKLLDDITTKVLKIPNLAPYEVNLFNYLRSYAAKNYHEYLTYIVQPVLYMYTDSSIEYANDISGKIMDIIGQSNNLIENVPTKMLTEGLDCNIPEWLKKRLIASAWTRYILLGEISEAENISSLLVKLNPELNDVINGFLSEKNLEVKQKLAHLIIMRSPGLNIFIKSYLWRNDSYYQKDLNLTELSMNSENWWNDQDLANFDLNNYGEFLTKEDKELAKKEWSFFKKNLSNKVDYFCHSSIDSYNKFKDKDFIPEMLHLCVKMSKKCHNAPKSSYEAFIMLHKYYKNNKYTLLTPYNYYVKPK